MGGRRCLHGRRLPRPPPAGREGSALGEWPGAPTPRGRMSDSEFERLLAADEVRAEGRHDHRHRDRLRRARHEPPRALRGRQHRAGRRTRTWITSTIAAAFSRWSPNGGLTFEDDEDALRMRAEIPPTIFGDHVLAEIREGTAHGPVGRVSRAPDAHRKRDPRYRESAVARRGAVGAAGVRRQPRGSPRPAPESVALSELPTAVAALIPAVSAGLSGGILGREAPGDPRARPRSRTVAVRLCFEFAPDAPAPTFCRKRESGLADGCSAGSRTSWRGASRTPAAPRSS